MTEPDSALKARLAALTDGIFAVTMTLLVLDLRVPDGDAGSWVADLLQVADRVDNYAISFVVLSLFWLGHVRMLGRMRGADGAFAFGNLAFLLLTTLVPTLTSQLGEHPALPRPAVLYGANLLSILVCELALWHRVCHRLGNDALADAQAAWHVVRRRYALSIAVVVAGIATALVEIALAASQGLAPWLYLLLIGMGLVRPPLPGGGEKPLAAPR